MITTLTKALHRLSFHFLQGTCLLKQCLELTRSPQPRSVIASTHKLLPNENLHHGIHPKLRQNNLRYHQNDHLSTDLS